MNGDFYKKFREKAYRYETKSGDNIALFTLKMIAWLVKGCLFYRNKRGEPNGGHKVALRFSGGVGDMVINALYAQQLRAKTAAQVDIYSDKKEILEGIFLNKNFGIRNDSLDVSKYDAVIFITRFPTVESVSARIMKGESPLSKYLRGLIEAANANAFMLQTGVVFDFAGMEYSKRLGKNRYTQADFSGELQMQNAKFEIECALDEAFVRSKFGLGEGQYITIQRGSKTGTTDTKLLSNEAYARLVKKMKSLLPEMKIVQLGRRSVDPIKGVDMDLRGDTSFEELKGLLKYSAAHVDCECGMVHLKHGLGGKSLVFFGPTDIEFYAYAENVNICSDACKACEWLTKNWGDKCLRGFENPPCMAEIDVDAAAQRLKEMLQAR